MATYWTENTGWLMLQHTLLQWVHLTMWLYSELRAACVNKSFTFIFLWASLWVQSRDTWRYHPCFRTVWIWTCKSAWAHEELIKWMKITHLLFCVSWWHLQVWGLGVHRTSWSFIRTWTKHISLKHFHDPYQRLCHRQQVIITIVTVTALQLYCNSVKASCQRRHNGPK